MFERLGNIIKAFFNSIMGKMEDPAMLLEQTYQDLQSNLIQVRQAVAQAIATERQLEQQLQTNKDQAQTWQNRAAMAVQQGKDDLARQALQRKQSYQSQISDLETQLVKQREATNGLRTRLQELESEVQKAYTKKQVLIARDKAAQATSKANEILSKTTASGALSVMERMENKVQEKEAKAQALSEMSQDTLEGKFKSFEGKSDIEMELLQLKGSMGLDQSPKLIVDDKARSEKDAVLVENKEQSETVDAQEVKEISDNK